MREPLGDPSLVDEQPAGTKDTCDFADRGASTIDAATNVVAGSEIDYEIEAPRIQGKCPRVASHHTGGYPRSEHLLVGARDQHWIDIQPNE